MSTPPFRLAACVLVASLAACSSGGGGDDSAPRNLGDTPPFTPSADIGTTHAWALRRWIGTARSDAGGPPGYLSVQVTGNPLQVPSPPPWASVPASVVGDLNLGGQGNCQAGDDQLFVRTRLGQFPRCTLLLTASADRRELTGRYEVFLTEGAEPADRGSVSLGVFEGAFLAEQVVTTIDGSAVYVLRPL